MLLEDVKKEFLSLIDEYAPDNTVFTEDEDADIKFKTLVASSYSEMANIKPILKVKEIEHEVTNKSGYSLFKLPEYKQLKKINVLNENNERVSGDYYIIGDRDIYISNSSKEKYIVEYFANPTLITDKTSLKFQLEIDEDAQQFLPYMVAADYLKTDPSANYAAFEQVYQRKLNSFDSRKKAIKARLSKGVF